MALGYNVAIVTNDDVSVHASFASRQNIAFTLLADEKAEIIEALGMTNPQFPKGTKWYGVGLPGILAINPKGVVTHRFITRYYRDRSSPEAVLTVLRKGASG